MAKKKVGGRSDSYKTGNVYAIRGTDEWKSWVDSLAVDTGGLGVADMINIALIEYADRRKIKRPAPPRLG